MHTCISTYMWREELYELCAPLHTLYVFPSFSQSLQLSSPTPTPHCPPPQTKCHRYWPEPGEPHMYGDINVEPVSEKAKEDWTIRELNVSQVNSSVFPSQKKCLHIHVYTAMI